MDIVERNLRKTRVGTVVSDKMDKTIVVQVERRKRHPLYGRIITRRTKFNVHEEYNFAVVGVRVWIMETRPLYNVNRWGLVEIVEKAR